MQDFDRGTLKTQSKTDSLHFAIVEIPDNKRRDFEEIFRQINELSHEAGIRTLIDEGDFHNLDLDPLGLLQGFEEKGLCVSFGYIPGYTCG